MSAPGEWLRRARYLINRRRIEDDLRREMEAHRDMMGTPARFGNTLQLREDARDVWGWRWLDDLTQDLRYAVRTLFLSHRTFAIAAVLDARRSASASPPPSSASSAAWCCGRCRSRSPIDWSSCTARRSVLPRGCRSRTSTPTAATARRSRRWPATRSARVTCATPAEPSASWWCGRSGTSLPCSACRLFTAGPTTQPMRRRPSSSARRSGGAASEGPATSSAERWCWTGSPTPSPASCRSGSSTRTGPARCCRARPSTRARICGCRSTSRCRPRGRIGSVTGRLKPGVSLAAAQSELNVIAKRLEAQYPDTNQGRGIAIVPLSQEVVPAPVRRLVMLLFGAVVIVLALACANVANLSLARMTIRQREVAVRAAIGASPLRLVRQFLAESLLLSLTGGIAGLLLAWWILKRLIVSGRAVSAARARGRPRLARVRVHARRLRGGRHRGRAPCRRSSRRAATRGRRFRSRAPRAR